MNAVIRHLVLAGLCYAALVVHVVYRFPGNLLFVLLPWVGMALVVVNALLLVNDLFSGAGVSASWRRVIARIEQWAYVPIGLFVLSGTVLFFNGAWDRSTPVDHPSEVLKVARAEVDVGRLISLSWVELRAWNKPRGSVRVLLQARERRKFWQGQRVIVQVRAGSLRIPWVFQIDRDEAQYALRIIRQIPTAAEAWKTLIRFYLDHQRWEDAYLTVQEYLRIYPQDYEFAEGVAAVFGQARHNREVIAILEPFLSRRPNYNAYNMVGFAFSKLGQHEKAVELLNASIPLNPEGIFAYYHLGYVYRDMGNVSEAIAAFEKFLELQRHFPEVEAELARLRGRLPR